jgi:diaminopimelate epimerase
MHPEEFIKYHGLGNDFVIFLGGMANCDSFSTEQASAICARGHGMGADGVALARPSDTADVRMELINSDGSIPEMCGNGLRCFVKYAVDELQMKQNPMAVETNGGVRLCHWNTDHTGNVSSVRVDMGEAFWERSQVPMTGQGSSLGVTVEADGRSFLANGLNTGNPHMVIFGDADRDLAAQYGSLLTHHPMWPLGANVEFAKVHSSTHIQVSVWERGCGLTEACGTGATATVCAAVKLGKCAFNTPITVELPGGELTITVEDDFTRAWMEGPAVEVYRGRLAPVMH